MAEALAVPQAAWAALLDGGWLWLAGEGAALPTTLRRFLAPLPAPEEVRRAAQALQAGGFAAAALDTLAAGGCWADYLDLLAWTTRSAQGEAALRARLGALPPVWREQPPALYVAGLLARAAHDLSGAHALYTSALAGLAAPATALAHNARGVVRAMEGDVAGALDDFAQAAHWPGLTAGEANHNRATLLVQQGRHAEAERSLNAAVAAFRAAADPVREARSLETLGTLQFGRGLLREALGPYRAALTLLRDSHPTETALALLNLAECHLLLGELAECHAQLQEASAHAHLPGVRGWTGRLQALAALQGGDPAGALEVLARTTTQDRSLQAEVALLQARAQREQGQPGAARAALAHARPLGLRAELEAALLGEAALDDVIEAARAEEARLELATALLERGAPDDLREALDLIQTHGYLPLLGTRAAAPWPLWPTMTPRAPCFRCMCRPWGPCA
ncbi:tetratricopeptide repeat protein [Deinococcus multiflagellatus]|uniref:Tetratricopeptide repeat protein n=1 Tax=Deinococcus multiflagellatus TaxID=1656887 RepID=A0ABW1ZHL5_9DEIO